MNLKSLAIFEKASISKQKPLTLWKKLFKKTRNVYKVLMLITKHLHYSLNVFQKPLNPYKSLTFLNKTLYFLENELKKPQNL
jgi:hypothetical protein